MKIYIIAICNKNEEYEKVLTEKYKKLIEKKKYKTYEKNDNMYCRYRPKKKIRKNFKKGDPSNSPFKILKKLNFN